MRVKTLLSAIRAEIQAAGNRDFAEWSRGYLDGIEEGLGSLELPALDFELSQVDDKLGALAIALDREYKARRTLNADWGARMVRVIMTERKRGDQRLMQKTAATGETLEAKVKRLADTAARKVGGH